MKNFILLSIIISVISLSSCGKKNETSGDKKEDSKQEVKKDNNDYSGTKDNESNTKKENSNTDPGNEDKSKANELGMTPGMPTNFPADVPLPRNSKTLGSLNSSEGTIVTFESNDRVMDIVSFYKDEMNKNGYTISEGGESLISEKGGLINWMKDKKEVGLMLGYDKDKNITSLVITYK